MYTILKCMIDGGRGEKIHFLYCRAVCSDRLWVRIFIPDIKTGLDGQYQNFMVRPVEIPRLIEVLKQHSKRLKKGEMSSYTIGEFGAFATSAWLKFQIRLIVLKGRREISILELRHNLDDPKSVYSHRDGGISFSESNLRRFIKALTVINEGHKGNAEDVARREYKRRVSDRGLGVFQDEQRKNNLKSETYDKIT